MKIMDKATQTEAQPNNDNNDKTHDETTKSNENHDMIENLFARRPPPTGADRRRPVPTARTCPISDCWFNFTHFGSQNGILTKLIDDSAWFLQEKLKNPFILTKNLNI